jgi:ribonuclease Z
VGFDRLLRLMLGRDKHLCIYGPRGLLRNIEGKLAGYTWNLVNHYPNRLTLQASEVEPHRIRTRRYASQDRFQALQPELSQPFEGVLLHEPAVRVTTAVLDHRIPSLGFCVEERFHVNILKEEVLALGLAIGPWLKEFKQALFARHDPASVLRIPVGPGQPGQVEFSLGALAARIALISPGQKIGYIADVGWSAANTAKIVSLVTGADHLYIEAAFLERHREVAAAKYHLTARQAGTLAALARVKAFTLFHFSPRYTDQTHLLEQEAREAYVQTRTAAREL